ncbi:MAG: hypothetical protein LEGION0398_MBIBDBAK_00195 [Legionellaceae bacterium]
MPQNIGFYFHIVNQKTSSHTKETKHRTPLSFPPKTTLISTLRHYFFQRSYHDFFLLPQMLPVFFLKMIDKLTNTLSRYLKQYQHTILTFR